MGYRISFQSEGDSMSGDGGISSLFGSVMQLHSYRGGARKKSTARTPLRLSDCRVDIRVVRSIGGPGERIWRANISALAEKAAVPPI